jgi:NAD(P)-dependent dehydrogenase (short-subunit alcohol dehydrogenase family)
VEAGARVVVVGRNPDSVTEARSILGENAVAMAGDAAEPDTAVAAIRACLEAFGRFDGLYHVAGGSGRSKGDGPLHEITDEGWQATMNLNLTSLFNSNRAAVRALMEAGTPGVVLNMSSVLGVSPSPAHFSTHAYSAAKSAVLGFTRSCASYYANRSIRFNVIAPALVETPMSKRAIGDAEIVEFVRTKQPLDGGRPSVPADLDAAVVFLLSDGAKLITGQWLNVDGGWTVTG